MNNIEKEKILFNDIAKDIAYQINNNINVKSDKIEYDFDIDLVIKQANEIDCLQRLNNVYKKRNKQLSLNNEKLRKEKHIYKVEMERCRRKLTRIYAYLTSMYSPILDLFKNL